MYQIALLNKISKYGLECFGSDCYQIGEAIENPDAIMVRSAAMADMTFGESLLAIGRAGAGVNNIPVERCSQEGIVVFNTPGANANAVKELVVAGLLLSSRKVVEGVCWAQTLKGQGDKVSALVEKGKGQFVGPELEGKKLGVIGLGAIGVLVCNIATHFHMDVYGYDPYISVEGAWSLSRSVKKATDLKHIFEECDYITVHVPLTPETKEMFNVKTLQTMKKGVRILNFSRGELVNSSDMIAALENGIVERYVTDFPTDAMIGVPGILAIPHLGASTPESEDNCAKMAALELIDFLENGNIKNSVNLPNVEMPRSGGSRICVVHKNVPNILASISSAISSENINIENMINKSKKEYAYTMVDISGKPSETIVQKITGIPDVIRVRVI